MPEYTIREFRMKLKEAFEAAERGDVYITRKGQRYRLCVESVSQQLDRLADEHAAAERELYGVPDTSRGSRGQSPNTPTPEIPETPKVAETITKPGLPCCNQSSPCKHWRWDAQLAVWQNILTGEVREAQ
jgi:hypothetical protein